jgi:CHASE1-domain containing sensor protein
MRLWKNWFPIALAIVWVVMAAMAMVDFASFNAATRPQKAVVKEVRPVHSALSRRLVPAQSIHD